MEKGLIEQNELKAQREAYKGTIRFLETQIFKIDKSLEVK